MRERECYNTIPKKSFQLAIASLEGKQIIIRHTCVDTCAQARQIDIRK